MKREELNERKRLLELQADHTRWFSQEEFDRLRELSNKMFAEHPLPPAEGAVPDNAAEQNKWMREWFKERTGLDDTLLSIHMKQIDVMLKGVQPQPTAEDAEEILASLIESLGEPTKIHNHIYEIRPYTVEGKTEWWMFHKGVGSGEPLAQWLNKFATLHARKMARENLREELIKFLDYIDEFLPLVLDENAREIVIKEYLKSKEQ